jgi:hypothetical protein
MWIIESSVGPTLKAGRRGAGVENTLSSVEEGTDTIPKGLPWKPTQACQASVHLTAQSKSRGKANKDNDGKVNTACW